MMMMQADLPEEEEDDEDKICTAFLMGDRKNSTKYEIFVK